MSAWAVIAFLLTGLTHAQICAPTAVVRSNSQVTSKLGSSNCVLADGTWFADYLVDFPSRGMWSGSVTGADGTAVFKLLLRDQSGSMIDSGSSIQRIVDKGSYHILVNAPAP